MKKIFVLCLYFLSTGVAWSGDEFSSVRCGADIPRALMGKSVKNEKNRVTEDRHKDIGLQNLGGDEISNSIFMSSWMICGREYFLLYERDIIREVLPFPEHDKNTPAFGGHCLIDGKEVPEMIYAVLDKEAGMETYPAKAAWKLDEKSRKFVALPVSGLRCPRDEIFSVDR